MKHLVYCILRSDVSMPAGNLPYGMNAEKVAIATSDGLAAVYSVVPETCAQKVRTVSSSDCPDFLVYAEVIEAFHEKQTVLPMRYGCLLENEEQVVEPLQRRSGQFKASLEELDGCVEVGVRALLGDEGEGSLKNLHRDAGSLSGKGYMACRAAYYAEKDAGLKRSGSVAQEVRRAFDGLFVKCEVQRHSTSSCRRELVERRSIAGHGQLLSLLFLVRNQQLQSFRDAFRQLQGRSSHKLLLTGPWPPYSFVRPMESSPYLENLP